MEMLIEDIEKRFEAIDSSTKTFEILCGNKLATAKDELAKAVMDLCIAYPHEKECRCTVSTHRMQKIGQDHGVGRLKYSDLQFYGTVQ